MRRPTSSPQDPLAEECAAAAANMYQKSLVCDALQARDTRSAPANLGMTIEMHCRSRDIFDREVIPGQNYCRDDCMYSFGSHALLQLLFVEESRKAMSANRSVEPLAFGVRLKQ